MNNKTSIIIPSCNGLSMLKQCVASIRKHTSSPYELIVVDNGSSDGTDDYCRKERITFAALPENRGFPAACNVGLRIASGDALLLLNNDVTATPRWLEQLLRCLNSDKQIGIVGPVTNFASGKQQISLPHEDVARYATEHNRTNPALWQETLRLIGFCFLFKRTLLERIGLLDERFSPGHYEDDDYCYRARQAGFRLLIAADTFVIHEGGASFSREGEEALERLLATNKRKFIEKWHIDPSIFI